jgi:hypothetical protein
LGKFQESFLRGVGFLRLLRQPLAGPCLSGFISAETLRFLVLVGLPVDRPGHRLAQRLPMGLDVLADGKGWEVIFMSLTATSPANIASKAKPLTLFGGQGSTCGLFKGNSDY